MRIAMVAPEAVPYAKTGGLADVVGALQRGMNIKGHDCSMFLPCYERIQNNHDIKQILSGLRVNVGDRTYYYNVFSLDGAYFIANDFFFNRSGLYGDSRGDFPDNAERFAFFCKAVLQTQSTLGIDPEIYHVHDWQTGLLPFYLYQESSYEHDARSVLTIHNAGYQGVFPPSAMTSIGASKEHFGIDSLEFHGNISLLKAGIVYSDSVTTVSPTYAREITETSLGYGLEGLLSAKGVKGILNGIDYDLWDPSTDTSIHINYDVGKRSKGKSACKKHLCKILDMNDPALPVIGVIGRFSWQKGYDIIAGSLTKIISMGFNVVILGSGDLEIERSLRDIAVKFPGRVSVNIGFNDALARNIYAGSDLFLMPSRYEPCGLAQMIAMSYGSIPVVRHTGGLADTIKDHRPSRSSGTGFIFRKDDSISLLRCLGRALKAYNDRTVWQRLTKNSMMKRFTWDYAIDQYIDVYSSENRVSMN